MDKEGREDDIGGVQRGRGQQKGGAVFDPACHMAKWQLWLVDGDAGAVAIVIRVLVNAIVDVGGMLHVCDRKGHAGVVTLDIILGNVALAVATSHASTATTDTTAPVTADGST